MFPLNIYANVVVKRKTNFYKLWKELRINVGKKRRKYFRNLFTVIWNVKKIFQKKNIYKVRVSGQNTYTWYLWEWSGGEKSSWLLVRSQTSAFSSSFCYCCWTVWHEIFAGVCAGGLAIFCVLWELIFAIRTDWFFAGN